VAWSFSGRGRRACIRAALMVMRVIQVENRASPRKLSSLVKAAR